MYKLKTLRGAAPALSAHVGLCALLLLAVAALAALAWPAASSAQSGRRRPAPISPAATPTPPPAAPDARGESESVPRGSAGQAGQKGKGGALATFVVFENDDAFLVIDRMTREDITEAFLRRLGQAEGVSTSTAGRGSRKEARDRAKIERDAFVVLFQVEEDNFTAGSSGRSDPRTFVIRTYVFAPQTGDLKFQDTIHQRRYRETTTIGGVRVPVPGRRVERYPSELQLQQAARDAADRLLQRLNIQPPLDR